MSSPPKRLLYYFLDPKTFFIKHHLVVHNIKFLKHLSFCLEELDTDPKAAAALLKHITQQRGVKSLSVSNMSKSKKNLNAILNVTRQNQHSIKNFSLFPSQLLDKKECIKAVQNITNLAHIKLPARRKELKLLRFCRSLETLIPHHSGLAEMCMVSTVTALKHFLCHRRKPLKLLKMFVCNKKYGCPEAITPTPEMCFKIERFHYVIEQHLLVPFNADILFRKYILQRIKQLDLYLRECSFLDFLLERGHHLYNLESLFFTIKETSSKEMQKLLFSLRNLSALSNLKILSLWIVQHVSNKEFFSFLMNAKLPEGLEQLSIYAHVEDQEMNNAVLRRKGKFFFPSSLKNLALSLKTSNLTSQIALTFALIQMLALGHLKSFDFKVVNTNRDNYTGITSTAKNSWTNEFRLNLNDLFERLNQIESLESFSVTSPYLIFNGIKEENFPTHLSKMKEVSLAGSYPLMPCNLNSYIKILSPEDITVLQIDTKEVLEEIDFIKRLNLLSKMTQLNFLSTNVDVRKAGNTRFDKIYLAIIELIRALRHLEKLFFSVKSLRFIDNYVKTLSTTLEFHQKLFLFNIIGNNFSLYKNLENGFGNLLA